MESEVQAETPDPVDTDDESGTVPSDPADLAPPPGGSGPGTGGREGRGPYDASDAPTDGRPQLDLGSLRIPMLDGVEVRVQADPDGRIQQVALVSGPSSLQLTVLAAPRTEDIWEEVRGEIRAQLRSDGFASQETEGDYGTELRTRVRTPEGPTDLRFVGVSSARWLVRAIFQGPAAVNPTSAPALLECLHGLVVDRGHEAMPAGEALALRLPKEITDQHRPEQPADPVSTRQARPATRRRNPESRR